MLRNEESSVVHFDSDAQVPWTKTTMYRELSAGAFGGFGPDSVCSSGPLGKLALVEAFNYDLLGVRFEEET